MYNGSNDVKRRRAISDAAKLNLEHKLADATDWKSESSEYQTEFLSVSHLLADMEVLASDPDITSISKKTVFVPFNERLSKQSTKIAVVASLVISVVAGLLLYQAEDAAPNTKFDRYITRVGEQRVIDLPDGSSVTLNTGSELLVGFSESTREIALKRGEAYFEVEKDPLRPFTVDAGLRSVTVLGTAFNVRKTPDKLHLAVADGVVAVHSTEEQVKVDSPVISYTGRDDQAAFKASGQYRLTAGWVIEAEAGEEQMTAYMPKEIQALTVWRTGILDFDNWPLIEVVRELNRYSAKKILIEDPDIYRLEVLGVMQVSDMDQALRGLEAILPIKIEHYFDRIVLVGEN